MAPKMTEERFAILKKLAQRTQTAIDLVDDRNIAVVQDLVKMGYARDYSDHAGHRIPVRLRIWGITSAGRAVIEQEEFVAPKKIGQLSFSIPKPPNPGD